MRKILNEIGLDAGNTFFEMSETVSDFLKKKATMSLKVIKPNDVANSPEATKSWAETYNLQCIPLRYYNGKPECEKNYLMPSVINSYPK